MAKTQLLKLCCISPLILSGSISHAKLDIQNNKAVIDISDLKTQKPVDSKQAIAEGVKTGAIQGGIIGGIGALLLSSPRDSWTSRLAFTAATATVGATIYMMVYDANNMYFKTEYEAREGLTLCGAVAAQKKEIVSYLLYKGHNPYEIDAYGHNAFHYAAATGNSEILTLLATVTFGAVSQAKILKPINRKDAHDRTPAMIAAQCNNEQALKILLKAGADASEIKNQFGQTVLDMVNNKPALQKVVDDLKA